MKKYNLLLDGKAIKCVSTVVAENWVPVEFDGTAAEIATLYSYDEGLKFIGEQPTGYHYVSPETGEWVADVPLLRRETLRRVDAERDKRISTPLLYGGKRLDADARARENLKSKLEEIKAREALLQPMPTEMLVWRDADNITHTWATQESYKAWLEGFTIAMSERGTLLYAAAWQHKANIEALTDIDSILAYDVTAGWPS